QEDLLAVDPLQVRTLPDVPFADERQRLRALHEAPAGGQVQLGSRVLDGVGQTDGDPADVIDDLPEAEEVDLDEVVDVNMGELLQGLPQAGRATVRGGPVDLLHPAPRL